ncbi:MAG: flagellar basal body P-ring protein FlgI [Pirellulaceae bacterium]|nr:flagellar basal body P-ring protein FlgI [Pirellulaceae bacterium]
MKPPRPLSLDNAPLDRSPPLARREFLALGCAAGLATLAGCTTPLMRGQSPDVEVTDEKRLELIGDYTRPWGLNWVKLESVALVTNLANTGSDPPPGEQRSRLTTEMMSREVRKPDEILASPTTSLVLVTSYLPPAVQKGDPLDVEVRVPQRSETTSLRGGWLMQTRLRQMAALGGSIRTGSVEALAQGDILVDAVFEGQDDKILETRARVLGGGTAGITRQLGLAISNDGASIRTSTLIGAAINKRFFTFDAGVKKGVADPQRDNFIELSLSPRYKHNLARYLRVIRNIPMRENPVERTERLQLLGKKLLEPATAGVAALQLEAIGHEAAPLLKQGLESTEPEVRFYAAEALAYLDEPEAAAPLCKLAEAESAFRWHALTALATMSHVTALDALNDLLHVKSIETRYGAFRALRIRNSADPASKGESLGQKFRYHVIPTTGEPLIHIARSRAPEIVVFGHEQRLTPPKYLFAGRKIMITTSDTGSGDLKIGRFEAGEEPRYETCPPLVDKLIRTIVGLGGGYAEVIQCLQEAQKAGCLECRLAVEALPRPNRKFYKDDDPLPDAPTEADEAEAAADTVSRVTTPSPEMFTDSLQEAAEKSRPDERLAAPAGETYVNPASEKPAPSFLDKLKNPLGIKPPAR